MFVMPEPLRTSRAGLPAVFFGSWSSEKENWLPITAAWTTWVASGYWARVSSTIFLTSAGSLQVLAMAMKRDFFTMSSALRSSFSTFMFLILPAYQS